MRQVALPYASLAPASWAGVFARARNNGAEVLRLPVRWGDHSTALGLSDFHTAPRLRLERLLQLAEQSKMRVHVDLGLPAAEDALPLWAYARKPRTVVPSRTFGAGSLALRPLPALWHERDAREAFRQFVDEASLLLGSFSGPGGTVRSVRVTSALFAADAALPQHDGFLEALQTQQPSVADLNGTFSTSFRDTATAFQPNGLRVLLERRFWLAARLYHRCRTAMLRSFEGPSGNINPALPMEERGAGVAVPFFLDPVPVERCGDFAERIAPFAPYGILTEESAAAFRTYEQLSALAHRTPAPLALRWLEPGAIDRLFASGARYAAVASGTFVESRVWAEMRRAVQGGMQLLFASGTCPHYDETLRSTQIPPILRGETLSFAGCPFDRVPWEKGMLWVPKGRLADGETLAGVLAEWRRYQEEQPR